MADRLISANKFAEDIYRAWELWEKRGENCFVFSDIITPILVNQPTVEAEPVKHGRWIKSEKSDYNWECSNCGYGLTDYRTTYCYDCGAKMDLDEVEE